MPSSRPGANYGRGKKVESDDDEEDSDVDSDDDNPFGDKNAMRTPDPEAHAGGERRRGYGFREV